RQAVRALSQLLRRDAFRLSALLLPVMPRESGASSNHGESCGYWIARLRGRRRRVANDPTKNHPALARRQGHAAPLSIQAPGDCCRPTDWETVGKGGTLWPNRQLLSNCPIGDPAMGRYLLLWLLGIPIPILILIWAFGGLH